MKLDRRAKNIIAVGGGKGGVGKSIFSIALAADLAMQGKKVVLADFDLGSANLHTYLGVDSKRSLSDFFQKKVASLEAIIEDTVTQNLRLISGSEFMPGAANPAYWLKLKMIRHIKAIDADFVIIDLGAGVHFNVLDLFGIADKGIIITTPEPGAVINAYSFIKGALFRKIEVVFRQHRQLSPIIKDLMEKGDSGGSFTIDRLGEKIKDADIEMSPLIEEISDWFSPCLVANMMPGNGSSVLIDNLKGLCMDNLGLELAQMGSIPETKEIPRFLLNIPAIFEAPGGNAFKKSVQGITGRLLKEFSGEEYAAAGPKIRSDFDDDAIRCIMDVVDGADSSILDSKSRKLWKLRLFFKPEKVVNFLISKGVRRDVFFE